LKDEFEDIANTMLEETKYQSSWIADLLGGAISSVNWHEIAKSIIEDLEV
jgi:hypothetical protein